MLNIYHFWLKTVFSNYGSDFDVLISIVKILMYYIKNPNECTFFEIISILINFQALKFLQLPRFHQILSFSWNWQPQKTFVYKVSTFLEIITILTHYLGSKMTKIACKSGKVSISSNIINFIKFPSSKPPAYKVLALSGHLWSSTRFWPLPGTSEMTFTQGATERTFYMC